MKRSAFIVAFLASIHMPPVVAKSACQDSAGSIIFTDTMYGIALGGILTGLGLMSTKTKDHVDQRLSTGAFVGGGLGLVAGTMELALRDCPRTAIGLSHVPPTQTRASGVSIQLTHPIP